jgi:hypothetical protein
VFENGTDGPSEKNDPGYFYQNDGCFHDFLPRLIAPRMERLKVFRRLVAVLRRLIDLHFHRRKPPGGDFVAVPCDDEFVITFFRKIESVYVAADFDDRPAIIGGLDVPGREVQEKIPAFFPENKLQLSVCGHVGKRDINGAITVFRGKDRAVDGTERAG